MAKLWRGNGRRTWALVVVFACAGLSACRSADAPKAAPGPDVWATVDDQEIRRNDVEQVYRGGVQPGATGSDAQVLTVKLNILEDLITQNVLLTRAHALKLEASQTDIDNALAERKRSMSDETFQLELTQRGLTADDLKQGIRRELVVQKLIDQEVTAKVAVTDQDITDFYNHNRPQFNLTEPQFRLAQIVVTSTKNPQLRNRMNDDAGTPEEAKRKVDMVTQKLRAGGDFSDIAMDYSEDPQSVGQGGDLGFVPASALNRLAPQIRDVVLKMEPGNINTLTMGSNYTIVMLISREPAGQRELSTPSVRDGIRDMLKTNQQDLLKAAYVANARAGAKVTNYLAKQVVDTQGKLPAAAATATMPTGTK